MREQEGFGEHLRRLREGAGYSQETLAERAGLSTNAISALERGERKRPYPDTVRRLADALNLLPEQREALASSARRPAGAQPRGTREGRTFSRAPAAPDALIGRDREITVASQLLERPGTRVLTLTGPGGIGKTRLAMDLAAHLSPLWPEGVTWVELTPLTHSGLVLPAIRDALGIEQVPGEPAAASIRSVLEARRCLLILDTAEHVRDAASDLVTLLQACAGLTILATSRIPLGIRGEQEYAVPALVLPPAEARNDVRAITAIPAVELFVRAIRQKVPDFTVTADNVHAITAITRRLDGVPLALELAAARVPLLGVHDLQDRLSRALPLLAGGPRDLPPRHQTMEAAIRWSYELLPPHAQTLFRVLAVFSGGWTLDAAGDVASGAGATDVDILDSMAVLLDHSLVRRVDLDHGRPRFTMLGTFAEFGRDRLREHGEDVDALLSHLRWITALVQDAAPHLTGPDQDRWLDVLAAELDNVRAALSSTLEEAAPERLRLAASFWRFWYMRGHFPEGRIFLERCLATPGDVDDETLASALNGAGILAQESGNFADAEGFYARSLELRRRIGDLKAIASTLGNLGLLADHRGAYAQAIALYEESLVLSREIGDSQGIGNVLNNLGLVYRDLGDVVRSRELHTESLTVLRVLHDQRGTANALNNLGNLALDEGDVAGATRLHRESLTIRERLDDRPGVAMSLKNLGTIARTEGRLGDAASNYLQSLRIRVDLDDILGAIPTIGDVALLASMAGHHETAARLVMAVRSIRERLGAPAPRATADMHNTILDSAQASRKSINTGAGLWDEPPLRDRDAIALAIDFLDAMASPAKKVPEEPLANTDPASKSL